MGQTQILGRQFQVLVRQLSVGLQRMFLRAFDGIHVTGARGEFTLDLLAGTGRGD